MCVEIFQQGILRLNGGTFGSLVDPLLKKSNRFESPVIARSMLLQDVQRDFIQSLSQTQRGSGQTLLQVGRQLQSQGHHCLLNESERQPR